MYPHDITAFPRRKAAKYRDIPKLRKTLEISFFKRFEILKKKFGEVYLVTY